MDNCMTNFNKSYTFLDKRRKDMNEKLKDLQKVFTKAKLLRTWFAILKENLISKLHL